MTGSHATALFCSIGLVGSGMSLSAYGIGQCGYESIMGSADGSTVGICYGRITEPFYVVAGFFIALVGGASLRLVQKGAGWSGFFKGFLPLAAMILLVDPGGAAIFAAPLTLPGLACLIWRSRALVYRIACAALVALTVAEIVWIATYSPSGR